MMYRIRNRLVRSRQRGVAAVELALLLPILFVALSMPIFYGRYFWHHTVAHKAAHDAARYLSTISEAEMRTESLARAAERVARDIAEEELEDLNSGGDVPAITVLCGEDSYCDGVKGRPLPETVMVKVNMEMFDNVFGVVDTGVWGFSITAKAKVPYVGQ